MGIAYASTHIWEDFTVDTTSLILSGLKTRLVNAGWTQVSADKAYWTLTFTGQPSNNQTFVVNGETFTAKTSGAGASEFNIGAAYTDTATNLAACITTYGVTVEASAASGVVTISFTVGGETGNNLSATSNLSNATLTQATSKFGGYTFKSATTTDGLWMKFMMWYHDSTTVRVSPGTPEGEWITSATYYFHLKTSGGRLLEFIGCEYQFFVFLAGASTTDGTELMMGVPKLHDAHVPSVISSVANTGGAFEVTTSSAHGWTSGERVFVSAALGTTGLNGWWPVNVTGTTTAILTGSTYAGGYTASSAVAANQNKVSRAIWSNGMRDASYTLRSSPYPRTTKCGAFMVYNKYIWNDTTALEVISPQNMFSNVETLSVGGVGILTEARIGWPVTVVNGTFYEVGDLWGAFLLPGQPAPMDVTAASFDSHNWYQLLNPTYSPEASLWLATS